MSFDPREYERTSGMYGPETEEQEMQPVVLWGEELDPQRTFASDLGRFVSLVAELQEAERTQLPAEVPAEYEPWTNTDLDLLSKGFISEKVLQNFGYQTVVVGVEGDRDKKICDPERQVAVYAHPDEARLSLSMIYAKGIPELQLVEYITHRRFPVAALPPASSPADNDSEKREAILSLSGTGLLERAFMLGTLKAAMHSLSSKHHALSYWDAIGQQSIKMYGDLVEEGCTPLGIEEVYGLMGTAIQKYLTLYPESAPLAQRQ